MFNEKPNEYNQTAVYEFKKEFGQGYFVGFLYIFFLFAKQYHTTQYLHRWNNF